MNKQSAYNVRPLFSQGVLNDAFNKPQTNPAFSIFGNGGVGIKRQFKFQPGGMVIAGSQVAVSLTGAGTLAYNTSLSHLVGQNNPKASAGF